MSANAPGSAWPGDPGLLGSVPILRPEQFGDATASDGTGVMQSAINAAAKLAQQNSGFVDIALTPGAIYNWGQLTLASGIRIWAYGAKINPILSEIVNGLLSSNTNISLVEVRGGIWQGVGTEGQNQCVVQQFGSAVGIADAKFLDMQVLGWGTAPLYFENPLRLDVMRCTLLTPGDGGAGLNAIDIKASGSMAHGDIKIIHNTVEGALAAAIAYVNQQNSPNAAAVRFLAALNQCSGSLTNGGNPRASGAILLEFDQATGGPWTDFIVALNEISNPNATTNTYALACVAAAGAIVQKTKFINNIAKCVGATSTGLLAQGAACVVDAEDNHIDAVTPIAAQSGSIIRQTGNRFSPTGPLQGRIALVAGAATVNTIEVQANDNIILSRVVAGGTIGELSVNGITAGNHFAISSSSATDTSTIYWRIDH